MGSVFLDNGAYRIKAFSAKTAPTPTPYTAPNALVRSTVALPPHARGSSKRPASHLVASELDHIPDLSALIYRRPHDRGFVSLWDTQRCIWNSVLSDDVGIGNGTRGMQARKRGSLLLTEHIAPPMHVRRATDDLCFSMFDEYAYVSAQQLAACRFGRKTCLVLDSGFSFTTAVPIVDGVPCYSAVRRLSVGGKLLTNYLKEIITFRSWNMMQETAIVNAIKERLCFVSLNYESQLQASRRYRKTSVNSMLRHYLLPDLSRMDADPYGTVLGEAQLQDIDDSDQILSMNNERISIPEILFNPSDIGLQQAGVPELIAQAIHAAPENATADLTENIILMGGNCRFPNFVERVKLELRSLIDSMYNVNVLIDKQPELTAYYGAMELLKDEENAREVLNYVSRDEYQEHGSDALLRRFYEGEQDSS